MGVVKGLFILLFGTFHLFILSFWPYFLYLFVLSNLVIYCTYYFIFSFHYLRPSPSPPPIIMCTARNLDLVWREIIASRLYTLLNTRLKCACAVRNQKWYFIHKLFMMGCDRKLPEIIMWSLWHWQKLSL